MAKKKIKNKIRLNSSAGTGYFYVTKKNPKKTGKLKLMKYDPKIRKHVEFVDLILSPSF
jgi:large subunit ribosomal protein L33